MQLAAVVRVRHSGAACPRPRQLGRRSRAMATQAHAQEAVLARRYSGSAERGAVARISRPHVRTMGVKTVP
jgi:hypothetical protein